jgi:hypothetical protein
VNEEDFEALRGAAVEEEAGGGFGHGGRQDHYRLFGVG